MKLNLNIDLTPAQQEAYDLIMNSDKKYIILNFSRQSGKSILAQVLSVIWLFQPKQEIAYVCKNYILAKKLYRALMQILPKQYVTRSNGTDLQITVNSSTLTFFSAESGDSLRGQTFDVMVCDEFAFYNFSMSDGSDLWDNILFPTIKAHCKKCVIISTPRGYNKFWEFYQRGLSTRFPKWTSLKKTIYDDTLISKEDLEEIKTSMPELAWKQEFLVEFIEGSDSFFDNYSGLFINKTFNTKEDCYIGIDLSALGKDATVVSIINNSGQVQQHEITGTLDVKYARIANIINNTPNLRLAYAEYNGLGAPVINEIHKLVKNKNILKEWITTNQSKLSQASMLQVAFDKNEITFDENNTKLREELGNFIYNYTKVGRMTLAARTGASDDRVLSLMIAMQAKTDKLKLGNYNFRF